jgi:hypothetical protein
MRKMILRDQARQPLEEILNAPPDRRRRARCQAILMAARGRRHRQIAADRRLRVRTLPRWWQADQGRGLAGLDIRGVPGRRAKIPEAWAPALRGGMTRGPAGGGLDRAHGTEAALAPSLYRTTGLHVRTTTRRPFCRRRGVRPSRPTSPDLKAPPDRQAPAGPDLQRFKKRRGGGTRPAQSRRGALVDGPHAADHRGAQRTPARGGASGVPRRGGGFRRAPLGDRAVDHRPGGTAPRPGEAAEDAVGAAVPASGFCPARAGYRAGLSDAPVAPRGAQQRHCPVAAGRAGDPGAQGMAAPGGVAAAQR